MSEKELLDTENDLHPLEVEAGHAEAQRVLERGNTHEVGKVFEDVLDEIYFPTRANTETQEHGAELEAMLRIERQFCGGVAAAVSDALRPQGLICQAVFPQGDVLRVFITDAQGRRFDVEYPIEDAIAAEASNPDSDVFFRTVVGRVCSSALKARNTYMLRMQ